MLSNVVQCCPMLSNVMPQRDVYVLCATRSYITVTRHCDNMVAHVNAYVISTTTSFEDNP
jgi:hypothetical protein